MTDIDSLTGRTILYVDASEDERALFACRFTNRRTRVICVASAQEALALLERELVDVIVSELMLPGVDGCDMIRAVRRSGDRLSAALPAIAVTASPSLVELVRAVDDGFTFCVTKPYDADLLEGMIERSLGVAHGARERADGAPG